MYTSTTKQVLKYVKTRRNDTILQVFFLNSKFKILCNEENRSNYTYSSITIFRKKNCS